jgi:hypothetical protein
MTLSEQLQRSIILHLCADSFFDDIVIVPDAMGYSPQVILNAVGGLGTPRPEGMEEPDPVTHFSEWLAWRNLGRGLGLAIVVTFPQAIDATGDQITTVQMNEVTVQVLENPDFNRSPDGLGIPGAQVQEAVDQALNARVMMLCSVPRSLNLRAKHPKDYETPAEGVIQWNVHFNYLGNPAVKERVTLGRIEVEQVSGSEYRARIPSGTTGATICIQTVPASAEFPILPTIANTDTTVAIGEWLSFTIAEPVTIIAMGYKAGMTPSVEQVAEVTNSDPITLSPTADTPATDGATLHWSDVGSATVSIQVREADAADWSTLLIDTTTTGTSYVISGLPWHYAGYLARVKIGSTSWEEVFFDVVPTITPQIGPQPLNIPAGQSGQPEIIDPLDTPLMWYLDGAVQNGGMATTQLTLTGLPLGSYLLNARIETSAGNGPFSNTLSVFQHD